MSQTAKPESLEKTVSRLTSTVEDHRNKINELEKLPKDANKLRFNSLLSEMQNADALLENHSRVSLVLSTGLLAFATTESVVSVPTWSLTALGGAVLLIWVIKIARHKQIFDHCHSKLLSMDSAAIRPAPKPWMHGFNLMYALVFIVFLAWLGVLCLPDTPKTWQPDNGGAIQEKLSNVGSQLDTALNKALLLKDHVDKIDNDTIVANGRLDALEIEVADIKRNLLMPANDSNNQHSSPSK